MRTSIPRTIGAGLLAAVLGAGMAQAADQFYPGVVQVKIYGGNIAGTPMNGTTVSDLLKDPSYPALPAVQAYVPYLEWQNAESAGLGTINDLPTDYDNNYGMQVRGVLMPKTSGNYVFYLAADDGADFWLSTDETTASMVKIVEETAWNNYRNWEGKPASDGTLLPQRKSGVIPLEAGKKYPFLGHLKEGTGGDHFSIAMLPEGQAPVNPDPANSIVGTLPIDRDQLGYVGPSVRGYFSQPQSATVNAGQTVTFKAEPNDGGTGTEVPTGVQWYGPAGAIAGATLGSYTTPPLHPSDNNGRYHMVATFPGGTAISDEATVTVNSDTVVPTLRAGSSPSYNKVTVTYSEPVDGADNKANYTLTAAGSPVAINSVTAVSPSLYELNTATYPGDVAMVLKVNANVKDYAGNLVTPSTANFRSFKFVTGTVVWEQWDGVGFNSPTSFIDAKLGYDGMEPTDPTPPKTKENSNKWVVTGSNWDNHGGSVTGWIVPPETGDYVFYTSSDDSTILMLSTDENPANKKKIATDPQWKGAREWNDNLRGGEPLDGSNNNWNSGRVSNATTDNPEGDRDYYNRSDLWPNTEWPAGHTIHLEAGKRYFMQSAFWEGCCGYAVGVTYRLASEDPGVITNGQETRLLGDLIGIFADPTQFPPTITTQPEDNLTIPLGGTATLTVAADDPSGLGMTYQWTWNGRDIAGATNASYTFASATTLQTGQYRVKVSNAYGTVTSGGSGDTGPYPTVVMVSGTPETAIFTIEAEDFDYDNGKTMPEASAMPYLGGAYQGLNAIYNVDYQNAESIDPGSWTMKYRTGDTAVAGTQVAVGGPANWGQWMMTRFGVWDMEINYNIGWIGGGDWGNYTRTFPTPAKKYWVFSAQAYQGVGNGELHSTVGIVTGGVGTTTQTVELFGTMNAQGSGNWGRNNLVAMTDGDDGPVKTVELGGTKTIRWNQDSGDADYLVFYPADAPPVQPTISAAPNAQGQPVITFTGKLYEASDIAGPYTVNNSATSPFTVTGGAGAAKFYRAGSQ
jgi:hypothetical protein